MNLLFYDSICNKANLSMAIRLIKIGDERLTYDFCQVCRIDLKKLRDRVNGILVIRTLAVTRSEVILGLRFTI